jgi:GH24 family phage-related lysozyme (muramidase)
MNDAQKRVTAAAVIATALAIPAEGLRQIAYYDPPGILTVCRGHTGSDINPKKKYSLTECDQFLTEDMRKAINQVERCVPGLPVPVLAAFGDAVFNLGPTIACNKQKSTAARLLASSKLKEACEQLPKWNKATVLGVLVELPGLTTRRNLEKTVCLEGIS